MQIGDKVERIIKTNTDHIPVGSTGVIWGVTSGFDPRPKVRWDHLKPEHVANYYENLQEFLRVTEPAPVNNTPSPVTPFVVKDSGVREVFASGMVRDTTVGKKQYHRVLEGPMFERWAVHLTKGAVKYPDNEDGTANWTKAAGDEERRRFRQSALRHFMQWYYGDQDEDHAAALFFNVNGAEYINENISDRQST